MTPQAVTEDTVRDLPLQTTKTNGATTKDSILQIEDQDAIQHVLQVFRCLIVNLCKQFEGGHPGSAMGMAAIGVALWKYVMRYSPSNPTWFNRDRLFFPMGIHACGNTRACILWDTRT
jgi:dihydroxyacetone synthase